GEIRMRLDKFQANVWWRAIDHGLHGVEQCAQADERTRRCRLLRDPRRILKNIAERRDERILACRVEIGKLCLHVLTYPISAACSARWARWACQCCAICSRVGTQTRSCFNT